MARMLICITSVLAVAIISNAEDNDANLAIAATCTSPTALGMENGLIGDKDITASSWLHYNTDMYGPQTARLNAQPVGGWVKHDSDNEAWIQVDLTAVGVITGLQIQGGMVSDDKRVTEFSVKAGTTSCNDYIKNADGSTKVFQMSSHDTQTFTFPEPIAAQYIRIMPKQCNEYCALRFEILGCSSIVHCPIGWEEFNGECYFFEHRGYLEYAQAVSSCSAKEATIVNIHSTAEQQFLSEYIFENGNSWHAYLIGLTDRQYEGTWTWEDGSPLDYTNWASREPNDYGGEDCAGLRPNDGGKWIDISCTGMRSYICEKPKATTRFDQAENAFAAVDPPTPADNAFAAAAPPTPAVCQSPVAFGMETGQIPGSYVTASTIWNDDEFWYGPQHGRLGNADNRWVAHGTDSSAPWIQVDLYGATNAVSGVITQGAPTNDEWVSSFRVRVGTEECDLRYIVDSNNNPMVFGGNSDTSTRVTNIFPSPVSARYVRIEPLAWHWQYKVSLRFEVLGCFTSTTPPASCDTGWTSFKANCYFFGTDKMSFSAAQSACQSKGAKLASIHDQDEQDFIGLHTTDDGSSRWYGYWVGLKDINSEGVWTWTDGTAFDYNNWASSEPNGDNEDCAAVWPRGADRWNDYNCGRSYLTYVCKKISTG